MPPSAVILPARVDSALLSKHKRSDEPTVIVKVLGVGSLTPYEYRGKGSRNYIFRFELALDGHVLRVPANIWQQNKGAMAHDIMDNRQLPHPFVVLVEWTAPEVSKDPEGVEDEDDGGCELHFDVKAPCCVICLADERDALRVERDALAMQVKDLLKSESKSQGASEAGGSHTAAEAGSTPAPETSPDDPAAEPPAAVEEAPLESPASEATEEPPPAGPTLHERIEALVKESKVRVKDAAESLGLDPGLVALAIESSDSKVTKGTAGWLKLKE